MKKVEVEEGTGSDRSVSNGNAIADLAGSGPGLDHAPIMSLFNNSILDAEAEPETPDHDSGTSTSKRSTPDEKKIRQKLLAYVPSDRDIDIIWKECSYWWHVWGRMFPELSVKGSEAICQYTKSSIASGSILALSKTLLCLSLAIQQLSASFVTEKLRLPIPADQLANHYISTVEKYIFGEDHYLTTLEGLELTVLLTKLNANAGRPRKAWLQFRRALSFALLLGITRKTMWQVTSSDPVTGPRRRALFWALYQGDRYFSLILGLPYSLTDQQCDIADITTSNIETRSMGAEHMFRLSNLCGRLIDRCQDSSLVTLPSTMKYDEELKELAQGLPSLKEGARMSHFTFDELYDRCLASLYHHYARVVLHLPFMLKSVSDRRFEYNRTAAVESSREMIYAFKILRAGIHGGYCACKTIDFQIFLGCTLLVLNKLAFLPLVSQNNHTAADAADWELVKDVRQILEKAAKESLGTNGAMQDSAVKTLDLFLEAEDGSCDPDCSTKVSIPYFGTITIRTKKEAYYAWERARKNMLTPATTLSSGDSPGPQQWQLPTPPRGCGSMSGVSSGSDLPSPMTQPYVSFDPVNNIPMPSGFSDNSGLADTTDFAFNDPSLSSNWNDLNWWTVPNDGIDLDLDTEWKWVVGNTQLPGHQNSLSSIPGNGTSGGG